MQYVLSLDVGTTSVKGVLFDVKGKPVAFALREYALDKPAPHIVELSCETYWNSVCKVIGDVLAQREVSPTSIISVGVTSQGETLIALDKDGRPLRKAIVWIDNRTQEEADEISKEFSVDEAYRITGQQEIIPTWTAARILWLRKNEPDTFAKAHKFLLVADYITYRLTGEYVTDRSMNPSTLYFDITTGRWWPEMLKYLGIEESQLPQLKGSGRIVNSVTDEAARQTGLSPDTVVTTAPMDQFAGTVGAGNLEPGVITETTGAALAICATSATQLYDPQKRISIYLHPIEKQYVLFLWAPTAGMVFRWFRDEFCHGEDYASLCDEAETIAVGADGLTMLPHLSGAGCPEFDFNAKGAFSGFTLGHTRGHFVRAVLESIAFMLRGNIELLEKTGVTVKEIRSLGGGAKSDLWLQIKADVCRKDILVMQCDEAACLGVAMLSCVGVGIYKDLSEARNNMVKVKKTFSPDSDQAHLYDAAYIKYQELGENLKNTF